jgi:hypothetical protein
MRHLYYPPRGDRGVATYNRACRFGLDAGALDRANDQVLAIVQIESAVAVAAAAEIASVDGVDVLFVGPRDLSHDLGVPGQVTAPVFVDAVEQVRLAARKHGKACGLLVGDGASAAAKLAEGRSFVTIGSDSALLAAAATAQLVRARDGSGREVDPACRAVPVDGRRAVTGAVDRSKSGGRCAGCGRPVPDRGVRFDALYRTRLRHGGEEDP